MNSMILKNVLNTLRFTPYVSRFTDIGKLWLGERTPEQLKGEEDYNTNSHSNVWHPAFERV